MSVLCRLVRTRLALRSAAAVLLVVGLLGLLSLALSVVISERRAQQHEYGRLQELLDTVERTAQIACFLYDDQLLKEVANGLLSNRAVSRVTFTSDSGVLLDRRKPGAPVDGQPLIRSVRSPFLADEEACRILLIPNTAEIRRVVVESSLFISALLTMQLIGIAISVILVIVRYVTRPITNVSNRLNTLKAETGQKLAVPAGNEQDEIGRLVTSVNAMIDHLVNSLKTERQLRIEREVEERRFRTIFDNVETGIFELDADGRVTSANHAFKRMFGLPSDGDLAAQPVRLQDLAQLPSSGTGDYLASVLAEQGPRQLELTSSNSRRLQWVSVVLTQVEQGRLQGVASDITERKLAWDAAEQMAVTDPLTGVGNRRGYERRLHAIAQMRQSDPGHTCVLMLLDLDNFKTANDSYGHAVGDRVLQHVAAQLNDLVRKSDYVARLGGDEFVVLLDGADQHDFVERLVRRFLDRVNQPLAIDGIELAIGASIGIAVLGRDTNSAQELILLADKAMYEAKQAGRNTFRFYSD